MNDADFVQGLREQKPVAVEHLTECFLPLVWRFVYVRVGGDKHLAEDIVSETVTALVQAAGKDVKIDNPSAWLRRVANNKIKDHYRAAARVQHLIGQVQQTGSAADNFDAVKQQELKERRIEVRRAMDELPEHYRIALEWKYVEKWSVRRIADQWETTEKAVEATLYRARSEFREKLQCRNRPLAGMNHQRASTNNQDHVINDSQGELMVRDGHRESNP